MKYRINTFAKIHRVTRRTVENWISKGIVKSEIDEFKHRWIIVDSEEKLEKELTTVIYSRVSSEDKRSELEEQEKRLLNYCSVKGYKISNSISEISGPTESSPKLESLILDSTVDIIVVDTADRVSIFDFGVILKLLEQNGRKIEVINMAAKINPRDKKDSLFDILSWYCKELYGKARGRNIFSGLLEKLEKLKP
jgi:predicted site-specific integrase-resolvase